MFPEHKSESNANSHVREEEEELVCEANQKILQTESTVLIAEDE